jgi:two-component system, NarL family, response regulator NreC
LSRSAQRLRVFLADDHAIVRQGLKAILQQQGFEVVGEAGDGHDAIRICNILQPDIAILDIVMPLLNGIDAARTIRKSCPNTKIVVLTGYAEESYVLASLRAGITGYVLKSNGFSSLLQAIEAVSKNQTYLSQGISGTIVKAFLLNGASPSDVLSIRERQVLQLIAEGKNMKEAGGVLGVSAKTVDTHRRRIMQKLNIFHTAGLVRYAINHGLILEAQNGAEDTARGTEPATSLSKGIPGGIALIPNPGAPAATLKDGRKIG